MNTKDFFEYVRKEIEDLSPYSDEQEIETDDFPFARVVVEIKPDEFDSSDSMPGKWTDKPDAAVWGDRQTGTLLCDGDETPDFPEGWCWESDIYNSNDGDYPYYEFNIVAKTLKRFDYGDEQDIETLVHTFDFPLPGDGHYTNWKGEKLPDNEYVHHGSDVTDIICLPNGDGRKVRSYIKQCQTYLESLKAWMETHTTDGEKILGELPLSPRYERNEYKYWQPDEGYDEEWTIKQWEIAERYARGDIQDYGVIVKVYNQDGDEIADASCWGVALGWGRDNDANSVREVAHDNWLEIEDQIESQLDNAIWDSLDDAGKLALMREKNAAA